MVEGDGGTVRYCFFRVWDKALAAAVFESLLVLPSRKTLDAAFAAFGDVTSNGALLWVSALAAADLEAFPVERFFKVLEAALAAFLPVPLIAIVFLPLAEFKNRTMDNTGSFLGQSISNLILKEAL